MEEVMQKFRAMTESPLEKLAGWKEKNGKKVVACSPMHFPEELIDAAGMLPVVLQETNASTSQMWSLKLFDLDKNLKSQLINENNISKSGADLLDVQFSDNPNILSLKTAVNEQTKYYSLDISKTTPLLTLQKAATTSASIVAQKKIGNDSYYLDNKGFLFENGNKVTSQSFPVKQETDAEGDRDPRNHGRSRMGRRQCRLD